MIPFLLCFVLIIIKKEMDTLKTSRSRLINPMALLIFEKIIFINVLLLLHIHLRSIIEKTSLTIRIHRKMGSETFL